MSTCPSCQKPGLISALLADGARVLLDAHAKTYVAVDEHTLFAEDGSKVFLTTALVEHAYFCSAVKREQADARVQGKRTYDQRAAAKRGA